MAYSGEMWFESPIQPAVTSQLRGMGSANQLAVDMPDQTVKIFYGITQELGAALTAGGHPQRPFDMTRYNIVSPQWGLAPNGYYVVTQFMGGFLLDGCPLNVIFGQGWLPGQQSALNSAGIVPRCPQVAPMSATAPLSTVQSAPIPSQTFIPSAGSSFTPTEVVGGIVTGPSPAAPSQTVYSTGGAVPPNPTQDVFDMGGPAGAGGQATGLPSWVPIAAVALIAAVLLKG